MNSELRRRPRGHDGHAATPRGRTGPGDAAQPGPAQRRPQPHRKLQQAPVPLTATGLDVEFPFGIDNGTKKSIGLRPSKIRIPHPM